MRRSLCGPRAGRGLLAVTAGPGRGVRRHLASGKGVPDSVGINTMWVIVAGCW